MKNKSIPPWSILPKNRQQKERETEVVQWSVFFKNDETIWTIGFNINLTELHFIHSVEIKFWTKNGNKALIVNC